MFIVFDLDGTLCDISHRAHHVRGGSRNWNQFFEDCEFDTPIVPVIDILKSLAQDPNNSVEIWSGRSDSVKEKTLAWLRTHIGEDLLKKIPISMRPAADYRPDTVLKEEWLNSCEVKPDFIFDDRQCVVDMWRKNGIVCGQVAPGDFDMKPEKLKRPKGVQIPEFVLMIGPSGAGKSAVIKAMDFANVVSTDSIRLTQFLGFCPEAYTSEGLAFTHSTAQSIAAAQIRGGIHSAYDATNLRRKNRLGVLKAIGALDENSNWTGDVKVYYLIVDRPLEEKLESWEKEKPKHTNPDVIKKHHETFQSSKKDALAGDGFSEIIVHNKIKE